MKIYLVRHAQSTLNAGLVKHHDVPNFRLPITELGVEQAQAAGKTIGKAVLSRALLYQSPYLRTRLTMHNMLLGAGFEGIDIPKIYEDPQLREVDHGYADPELQRPSRVREGWFWYRFDGGESAADCYDRCSMFISSLMRQLQRKKGENGSTKDAVIVTHGMIIRCLVMRFMHLSVEQFDATDTPNNCDIITIAPKHLITQPQFVSGKWAVSGLKMREPTEG
jgi:broad specificity phosphatase PhoE